MAKKFTTSIFLQKIGQLVEAIFHLQTTAEITSNLDAEGQFAYDTDVKRVKVFDGSVVKTLLQDDDIVDAATQIEVNDGIVTDEYVSPATLNSWATSGPGGQTAFFTWKYSTNTASADPGNGFFRGNNISASSVTKLYIDDITSGNQVDISNLFAKVKGQWLLHIQQRNDASKWMQFHTSIPYIDNTGWWTLDVVFDQTGSGGSLTNLTDCLFTFVNQNDTPSSQGSTGIQTFASPGLSIASGTTINIGAVTGWIVDNETNPLSPTQTYVNYPGVSGLTVTTIGSGLISYILLSSTGVISFQNTLPTSAQRKTHIWLGKVSHPNLVSLAFINNEPDFVLSPHASYNDLFQVLGPYINDGVIASANGANLNINITAGNIHGNGINFVTDNTNPNEVNTGPFSPLSFIRRTQIGTGGGFTTTVDVGNYDVAGTVTAIPGGVNVSTIQYIYVVPNVGFVIQYGQTLYNTLTEAIANVGRESQVIYSNLIGNSILVGVLVIKKSTTVLNNTADARFYQADKLGQIVGSTAGIATGTLQTAYNNSVDPEILTDSTRDGVTIRRGSAADTDNVLVVQNGAGTNTWAINGNGLINSSALTASNYVYSDTSKNLTSKTNAQVASDIGLTSFTTSYKILFSSFYNFAAGVTANTYFLVSGSNFASTNGLTTSGTAVVVSPSLIYIDSSDYSTINGIAPTLRIRAGIFTNHAAPTGNFTFGLYPMTSPANAGTGSFRSWTIGSVVSGSNGATQSTPSADTNYSLVGSDFALPANGWYAICVVTTATMATSSYTECFAMLQIHN